MDCCDNENSLKGGKTKMDKKTLLWILIALLIISAVYVIFFRGSVSGDVIDAGKTAGQVAYSGGMVGGC